MNKLRALFVVQLKAMLFSFRPGDRSKKRAVSGAGILVLMAALACLMSVNYSMLFAAQFSRIGQLPLLLVLMPILAVLIGFFFTLFAAQGVIFGGRDNDLMLSLPISSFTLMLTRTLALYLENLVFTLFVMIPCGGAYLICGGAGGGVFFLRLLFAVFFLALIPTCLSLICGFVLAWCNSKVSRWALLSTLLYCVFFFLLMAGVFQLNRLLSQLDSTGMPWAFDGLGRPFLWLSQGVCGGSIPALLGFCAVCLLPFLALVWLFAQRYKAIVTGLSARGARSDYKLGRIAAGSRRRALLVKEARRFFNSPVYLFNAGISLILLLIAAAAAVVVRDKLMSLLGLMEGLPLLPPLALWVGLLLSMAAITASSISLEGRQLWIVKAAPIPCTTLFAVKIAFQLLLCLPCLVISALCFGVSLSLSAGQILLLLWAGGTVGLFTAPFGLFINLCFPKLDAANDAVVVKQSASAMIATFGGMLSVGLAAGLYALTWRPLGPDGAVALCGGGFAVLSAVFFRLLWTKGKTLYLAL